MERSYAFDLPTFQKSIIKVVGVGGGGSNAVNFMFNQGIREVEFVVCNTDAQALKSSPIGNKIQIGQSINAGLGAGANPEKGREAALESKEAIKDMFNDGTKMVFITAGMGGGTGTGAAPVIAQIAKEMGILTVGIVTKPFTWEGPRKKAAAEKGIAEMRAYCDTVIEILNDKLRELFAGMTVTQAFSQADNVLSTAAKSIAEIITVPGYVNVDFEDVKTVMKDSGSAVMGSALSKGDSRSIKAAQEAISSPLLNNREIEGAQKILLSIITGSEPEMTMDELDEITNYIQTQSGENAELIFGTSVDPALGEYIRVTVIATGFEHPAGMKPDNTIRHELDRPTAPDYFNDQKPVRQPDRVTQTSPTTYFPKPAEPVFNPPAFQQVTAQGNAIPGSVEKRDEPNTNSAPTPEEGSKVYLDLDGNYKLGYTSPADVENPLKDFDKAMRNERKDKLKGLSNRINFDHETIKKMEEPTYLRKQVHLRSPYPESELSRVALNDEAQLRPNSFLHDNVD